MKGKKRAVFKAGQAGKVVGESKGRN